MADLLGVSRSGYYDWRDRPVSSRMIRNQKIVQDIKNIQKESRDYGCPRITNALRMRYGKIGHNRVARLMRENGLLARPKRRFVHTTDSNHGLIVAPNLLNRNFQTVSPNTVWVRFICHRPLRRRNRCWQMPKRSWSRSSKAGRSSPMRANSRKHRPHRLAAISAGCGQNNCHQRSPMQHRRCRQMKSLPFQRREAFLCCC